MATQTTRQAAAFARVEPFLADVCRRAGIEPLALRIQAGRGSATVGYLSDGGPITVTYPLEGALRHDDLVLAGALAHEVSHVTLRHVIPHSQEPAMSRRPRLTVTLFLTCAVIGATTAIWALAAIGVGGGALDSSGLPSPWAVAAGIAGAVIGGCPVAGWMVRSDSHSRPGWEGCPSTVRELAADLAAARIVGEAPMLAMLESWLPSIRIARWWNSFLVDQLFRPLASHASAQLRLAAVRQYDGSDPRRFAQSFLTR